MRYGFPVSAAGTIEPVCRGALLALLLLAVPGARLLESELERSHDRWIYELEYLIDGRVVEYHVDAASGRVLQVEDD